MSLTKNTASQGVYLAAYDTTASPVAGKASDQANITGAWSKDGGAETAGFTTAHPTNIGGGVYWQPLTQAETNGDQLSFRWASSTSGTVIDPLFITTTTAAAAAPTAAVVAAAVWDEVNTGATHNVTNSAGKQLRLINPNSDVIYSSTLPSQAGVTTTQVKLDSGASAVDNAYQYTTFSAVAGTGQGSRYCLSYVGSTRLATLDAAWTVAPVATDVVEITPTNKTQLINPPGVRRNVALAGFEFPMIDSANRPNRKTGMTVTATRSIDAAAFGACTNAAAEVGTTGVYKIDLSASDLNGATIGLLFTAAGCDDTYVEFVTQP